MENMKRPSKKEQKVALDSYDALASALNNMHTEFPEIEIESTKDKIKVPRKALQLFAQILKETSQGRPISIVPISNEITTQAAADLLGCSRPHVIKLLNQGKIKFTRVGKHRRIKYQDVVDYKETVKAEQRRLLTEIIKADEDDGLYDS